MKLLSKKRMIAFSIISLVLQINATSSDIASRLQKLAAKDSTHIVKVVFAQSLANNFGFPNTAHSSDLILLGYSTETGTIDTLQSIRGNYQRPLITHDGTQVVYSKITGVNSSVIYKINWKKDSTPEKIADGLAGSLYKDGLNEYVIYSASCGLKGNCRVKRININNLADDSVIFNNSMFSVTVNGHWLDVSSDMKSIADVWGYGIGGVAVYDIASATKIISGNFGCWPSMPYDTTKRMIRLADHHDGWSVHGLASSADTGTFGPYESGIDHLKIANYSTDIICSATGMGTTGSDAGGNITIWKVDSTLRTVIDSVTITSAIEYGFPDLWSGPKPATSTNVSYKDRHTLNSSSLYINNTNQIVTLYSSNGILIKRGCLKTIKAATGSLPTGVYFIKSLGADSESYMQTVTIVR